MAIKWDGKKIVAPDIVRAYTKEQIEELIKCKNDIEYFTRKYVRIQHPKLGYIKMNPYDYQSELLKAFQNERFVIVLSSRQSGKSTIVAVYGLWYSIFRPHSTIAVVSNKEASAKTILRRMRYVYIGLPPFLKPGVREWAKTGVEFDNGTNILVGPTSEDSITGESVSLLICDEFAKVASHIAHDFWSANYPTISTGGQCIVISTPKGVGNLFHDFWTKAQKGKNEFTPYRVDWWEVPGRDDKFKNTEVANLGKRKFEQEYGLKFLGSANTLINGETLERIANDYKDPIEEKEAGHLKIYDTPKDGHTYVMGVDVGKGTGLHFSTFSIFDITYWPEKAIQVAVYRNNEISTYDFPEIVAKYGDYFNDAWMMVENNDIGEAVINDLWFNIEYENLVNVGKVSRQKGKIEDVSSKNLGVRSTRSTKPSACQWFKKIVEAGRVQFIDKWTLSEICEYVEEGNKFKADTGSDDLVDASIWSLYYFRTKYFDQEEIDGDKAKVAKLTKEKDTVETDEEDFDVWGVIIDQSQDPFERMRLEFEREIGSTPMSWNRPKNKDKGNES